MMRQRTLLKPLLQQKCLIVSSMSSLEPSLPLVGLRAMFGYEKSWNGMSPHTSRSS